MPSAVLIQYQRITRLAINNNNNPVDLLGGTQGTDYIGTPTFSGNGILMAETLIRVSLWGNLTTAASSPGTLRVQLKFANSVAADTGALSLSTSLSNGEWELSYLLTMRDGGFFVCDGMFRVPRWPPDSQVAVFSGNANQTFTIGFNVNNTMQVIAQFSNAVNILGVEQALIEFLPRYS